MSRGRGERGGPATGRAPAAATALALAASLASAASPVGAEVAPATPAAPPRSAAARPDLRARGLPFVPRLTMRPAAAATAAPAATPARPPAATVRPPDDDPLRFAAAAPAVQAGDAPTDLLPEIRAQLVLGFAIDGAEPSARGLTLAGNQLGTGAATDDAHRARVGYDRARAYAFGDAVLGVDRIMTPGLSAYLAARFRIVPTVPRFAPVPTAWDTTDDLQVRAGWAEADGLFTRGPLASLVVRAGRQHVYGPAIAHLDGLWASWRARGLAVALYVGSRVPAWYEPDPAHPDLGAQRGVVSGLELSYDLRRRELPFTLRLRALGFEGHDHADLTVDWAARKDLVITGNARTFDSALAQEHVTLRYRVSEKTRLVIDGRYRHRRDPIWDFAFRDPDEPGVARRYLDRGPSLPRATARARAGTVLLDNIDVLVHGAFAFDARLDRDEVSYHAAGYLEGGTALEVRVRRAFVLGVSGMARTYNHRDPPEALVDVENQVQPLDLPPQHVGERTLLEGGVVARFSGGARRFSAAAEAFVRRTRWAERYRDDGVADPRTGGGGDLEDELLLGELDVRGGGRISFDAWVTARLRLRTEYDISSALDVAPEIRGLKSLRLLAEGQF